MQVFNTYFKIIKKNMPQMLIYLVIFLALSIFFVNLGTTESITDFEDSKTNVAFINYDGNSELVNGLRSYLSKSTNIIDIEDKKDKLQDALFFRKVEYIVRVPKGFTDSFFVNQSISLEKTVVPDSTSAFYVDILVNKYLNTASLYINNSKDITTQELIANIDNDLALKTDVSINSYNTKPGEINNSVFFFNYLAYSLFAIILLGVTSFMMVFNDAELKKRNMCSPIKLKNMNTQVILGNFVFALATWVIMIVCAFLIYGKDLINMNTVCLIINSLVLTINSLGISFLVGSIIKSAGAQSSIVNVLTLGLSFISGVFVPQFLLGETVLKIASFTPTYWYIKANNDISNIVSFNSTNLLPIVYSILIQLGFAVTILAVTLVIIKQKRLSYN